MTNSQVQNIADCLGVDGRRHHCVVWEETALCGMKILSKKENMINTYKYDCWECDGRLDGLELERIDKATHAESEK